jgi:hypothetical protein
VEGFNGTGGSGIATSGAFVNLDMISSHTETNYYAYNHSAAYGGLVIAGQSGNTLTVTALPGGGTNVIGIGSTIGVTGNPYVTALGSGSGGIGTYTVSGPAQTIASGNVSVFSAGRTNTYGGGLGAGAGPAIVQVASDNLSVYGTGFAYGTTVFNVLTGGFKNIVIDTQAPSTGQMFLAGSDLSGVHYRNQKLPPRFLQGVPDKWHSDSAVHDVKLCPWYVPALRDGRRLRSKLDQLSTRFQHSPI